MTLQPLMVQVLYSLRHILLSVIKNRIINFLKKKNAYYNSEVFTL